MRRSRGQILQTRRDARVRDGEREEGKDDDDVGEVSHVHSRGL